MVEDLTADLQVLQNQLDNLLDCAQQNSLTLRRFHLFEKKILNLNSLSEIVEFIFEDTESLFELDVISLCLFDDKGELQQYLEEDGYQQNKKAQLIFLQDKELLKTTFGCSVQPYLGAYKSTKCAQFFPDLDKKLASTAIIPLLRRGKFFGSLNLGSYNPKRFVENMATDYVEHMASVISICLENSLNFELLRRTSMVDPLTNVNNRRFLEQRLGEEIDHSLRNSLPLSCCFLDLDHFKSINDNYGHQVGDEVLIVVAKTIRNLLRNNDVFVRYGGEEFVALLAETPEYEAYEVAERIRTQINELPISIADKSQPLTISISIGTATFLPGNDFLATTVIASRLIYAADNALYKAKQSGRNCVINAGVMPTHAVQASNFK